MVHLCVSITIVKSENISASITEIVRMARESAKDFSVATWVLVPDRFTLECEKLLLSGVPCLLNTRVITFSMLFNIISTELGFASGILDKTKAVLYMWRAISDVESELCWYRGMARHYSFAEKMFNTINQLTSSMVDFERLESNSTHELTRRKMHDISLIQKRYKELIGEVIDGSGMLEFLIASLRHSKLIKNVKIFVCGFDHLSLQRLAVLEQIFLNCKNVNVGVQSESEADFQISEILFKNRLGNKKILSEFKNFKQIPVVSGHKNVNDEASFVANKVRGLLNSGVHPNDIAVVLCDYENTCNIYEEVFLQCGIDVNMDVGIDLGSAPLSRYLRDLISLSIHDSVENFLSVVKSGFVDISRGDLFVLENLCLKNNFGLLRVDGFEDLKNIVKCLSSSGSVGEICSLLLTTMNSGRHSVTPTQGEKTFIDMVSDKIEKLLNTISESLGCVNMSLRDFRTLFETLCGATKVSMVPTFANRVLVANTKEYQPHFAKHVVIANICEGTFPVITSDVDILTEIDIKTMKIVIEPSATMQNNRARTHVWNILDSALESLCVCYVSTSIVGEEVLCGDIIESLLKSGCTEEKNSHRVLNSEWVAKRYVLESIGNGRAFLDAVYYNSVLDAIDMPSLSITDLGRNENNIGCGKELFSQMGDAKIGLLGVTQIENYYTCPYMHFLGRGLRVRPRDRYKISPNIIGSIIHKIVEEFTFDLIEFENSEKKVVREVLKIVDEVLHLKEFSWFANDENHRPLVEGLRSESMAICSRIKSYIDKGSYRPKFIEKELSNDIVRGFADRIDVAMIDGKEYALVIDYKTGSVVDFKMKNLYMGTKLQLPLYLRLLKDEGYKIGGGLYFHLKSGFSKSGVMKGLVLDSEENAIAIDAGLATDGYKSDIVPIRRSSKGVVGGGNSEDEIRGLMSYADLMSKQAKMQIEDGVILKSSADKKACGYCVNSTMCMFKDKIRIGG